MALGHTLAGSCLVLGVLASGSAVAADASLCVSIADATSRLTCYDAALRPPTGTAAPTPPASAAPAMPRPAAAAAPVAPAAPVVAAAPAAAAAAPAKESRLTSMFGLKPKPEHNDATRVSLQATVINVQMRTAGQVITLDNDQVWQITEYQRDPFVSAHDAIVIEPASMGSFLLSRAKGGTAVRVKRLK